MNDLAKNDLDLDSIARRPTLLDYKRADESREARYGSESGGGAKHALEKELRRGAEFVGWFAAFALAAFLVLSIGEVAGVLAGIAAAQSSVFLSAAGVQNSISFVNGVPHLIGSVSGAAFDAEIADLCWGKLEFAVLFGIIAASFDRSRKQRALGFAAGFVFFALFFNPARIALSLIWASPLVHDVLFRVTLAAAIAFYYFLWYALSARGARGSKRGYGEGGFFEL